MYYFTGTTNRLAFSFNQELVTNNKYKTQFAGLIELILRYKILIAKLAYIEPRKYNRGRKE